MQRGRVVVVVGGGGLEAKVAPSPISAICLGKC